jgi:hypothetical protein
VGAERVGHALEIAPIQRSAVKSEDAGNGAHGCVVFAVTRTVRCA